jgi:hypothetical protein
MHEGHARAISMTIRINGPQLMNFSIEMNKLERGFASSTPQELIVGIQSGNAVSL